VLAIGAAFFGLLAPLVCWLVLIPITRFAAVRVARRFSDAAWLAAPDSDRRLRRQE